MTGGQENIKWDGREYPYIPSDPLRVDPSIKLHRAVAADLYWTPR